MIGPPVVLGLQQAVDEGHGEGANRGRVVLQRGVAARRVQHEPLGLHAVGQRLPPAVLPAVVHEPQQLVLLGRRR